MVLSIGVAVRSLFGPHELAIAELYRSVFLDMDALVQRLASATNPVRILEVGCGEGQMTMRLAAGFPHANILAIDISARVGRLYSEPVPRVRFKCCTAAELLTEGLAPFDLVTLCDVLHHVPLKERAPLLNSVRQLCAPGGWFVLKDWERRQTPIHWACALSDRFITGDRVRYCSYAELSELLELPPLPPWPHNRIWCVRLPRDPDV